MRFSVRVTPAVRAGCRGTTGDGAGSGELLVDEPECCLTSAIVRALTPAQVEVLLEQQEHLEQRRRLAREHLIVGDLEVAVAALEARAERHGRLVLVEQDRFLEELQQHLVETARAPSPCGSSAASDCSTARVKLASS
jgi:hypothetical protein